MEDPTEHARHAAEEALDKAVHEADEAIGGPQPIIVPPENPLEVEQDQVDEDAIEEVDDMELKVWLKAVKAILLAEGFKREIKQARKPGQVWGVIRQEPDDLQIHVRAFKDGRLESEVELSNKYVQHLWSKRTSAHEEVTDILTKHGMPTDRVNREFMPITGSKPHKKMPRGRLKTRDLVMASVGVLGLGVLFRALRKRRN